MLERQLGRDRVRFAPSDRVFLTALLHRLLRGVLRRARLLVRPDTVLHRLPLGDGDFDLPGFLTVLWSHRVQAPISIEVLSAEMAQQPPAETAHALANATRNVVTAARQSGNRLTS